MMIRYVGLHVYARHMQLCYANKVGIRMLIGMYVYLFVFVYVLCLGTAW